MYRAVFFDVGNTLIYPFPSVAEVCRQVLAEAGHMRDLTDIDELMPIIDAYYEDRYRDDDTFWTNESEVSEVWVGVYTLLCKRLGIDEDAEVLARRVYDEFEDHRRWRAYDDVAPNIERFSRAGFRTGIISNWDTRLVPLMDGLGLSEHLDTIVSSADVGLHKPDPRIFQLACDRLGVDPSEAVHVGDHHYADIVGATAVGMKAVLIDRHSVDMTGKAITTLDELELTLKVEV